MESEKSTASLPIQGSLGTATVLVRAKNAGGNSQYQQFEARLQLDAASIDLMPHAWAEVAEKLALRRVTARFRYSVGIGKVSRVDVTISPRDYSETVPESRSPFCLPCAADARSRWATQMIHVLKAGYPELTADPRSVIVAITDVGMDWFSWRDDDRFAVVSTAGLTRHEFLKQVTKNVGLLWFELPMSADSRSVLYDAVGGRRRPRPHERRVLMWRKPSGEPERDPRVDDGSPCDAGQRPVRRMEPRRAHWLAAICIPWHSRSESPSRSYTSRPRRACSSGVSAPRQIGGPCLSLIRATTGAGHDRRSGRTLGTCPEMARDPDRETARRRPAVRAAACTTRPSH